MATKTWVGSTSSDVATGANWSGGSVPASGDTAVWNSVTTYGWSGTFTNDNNIYVTDGAGYGTTTISRDVGTSASPVSLVVTANASFGNRGNVYVTAAGTIPAVNFDMPNGGTAVVSGGTWTALKASSVNLEVGASAVVTTLRINGTTASVATNGTAITTLIGIGRTTTTSRSIATAVISGPSVLTLVGTSAVSTTARLGSGSTLVHLGSGTVADAEIVNGSVYTVQGNNSTAATLTLAHIHRGGALIEAVPGFTLTVTTKDYVGGQSTPAGSPS